MQQIIRTLDRVRDAKGFLEHRHHILASKRSVGLSQNLEKSRLLVTWEFGRLTGLLFHGNAGDAVVPIGIDPCLNKRAASIDTLANLRRGLSFERQENRAIPIALLGIAFASIQRFEGFQIVRTVKSNVHRGILSVGDIAKRIMPQRNQSRNPNKNRTRPEINLDAYYILLHKLQLPIRYLGYTWYLIKIII